MLLTKWGENLDKSEPLKEYPRPQFKRESYLSLNGQWDLTFSDDEKMPEKYEYKITVPFSPETPLSGVYRVLKHRECLIYRKVFTLPGGFNKGRVFINFGAVDQIAKIYLNGTYIFEHRGGYTPFTVEITDYLKDKENELNIIVRDLCEENGYSRGKQKTKRGGIWYSPQSGIWQSVWLESTPEEYIKSVRITPDFDNSLVNFDFDKVGDEKVNIKIYDGDNKIADTEDLSVSIPSFKPWSPENPHLYNIVFTLGNDKVKSYFAMRKFSSGKDSNGTPRFFLNNKPYFFNGLLDQGYYPDGYLTPPDNKALEFDVKYAKDCGFNTLRKHIKIEPMLWYHYCDVNGIIVIQDMINGGGNYGLETSALPFVGINLDDTNYKTFKRENKEARDLYYKELKEMVDALYNCPCIAMWTPFNEGWGQFDSAKAYKLLKSWDKTRLVDSASGWHDRGVTDVISKHIYFTPIVVKKGKKPYFLSEFGGLSMRVNGHTFNKKMFGYKIYGSKVSLTRAYSNLYNKTIIPQIEKGLSATIYTQLTDVEDELNGLLTYDRKVSKIDKDLLQKINNKIKLND